MSSISEYWQTTTMYLTLVRHGETIANRERKVQGHKDGCLTGRGVAQANRMGERLAKEKFDAIICSDLLRTQQTLALVVKHRSRHHDKVYFEQLIREKGCGSVEGQPYGTLEAAAKSSGISFRVYRPAGGESWEDVKRRAEKFLKLLAKRYLTAKDGNPLLGERSASRENRRVHILVVTHGGFIKEAVNAWCKPRKNYPNKAFNTSLFRFVVRPQNSKQPLVSMLTENDCDHLNGWDYNKPDSDRMANINIDSILVADGHWANEDGNDEDL